MPEPGWPTLADVHREVQATRADVRQLCTEMRQGRRGLADHEQRLQSLRDRERWLAGGLAVLGLLVLAGVPALVVMVG